MSATAAKTASYSLRASLIDRWIAVLTARMPSLSGAASTLPALAAGVVMTATLSQLF